MFLSLFLLYFYSFYQLLLNKLLLKVNFLDFNFHSLKRLFAKQFELILGKL